VQRPGPPLWLGASAEPAVRRAARLDAGLLASTPDAIRLFLEERRALGPAVARARVALEQDAVGAMSGASRGALRAIVDASRGAACFDLVVSAEAKVAGAWIGPDILGALLALRDELRSAGAG